MYFSENKKTNCAFAIGSKISDNNNMYANVQIFYPDKQASIGLPKNCIDDVIKELEKIKADIELYEKQKAIESERQSEDDKNYKEFIDRRNARIEEERRLYSGYGSYMNHSSEKNDWFDKVCEKIFGF